MIPSIPWYVTLVALATNVAIPVAVWSLLSSAAGRSGLPPAVQRRFRLASAAVLGAWLVAALLFAPSRASLAERDPFYLAPSIPLFFGTSITAALLLFWRSQTFRRVLAATSLPVLHAAQIWRVVGILFVILYAQGQLPAHFALPAGWGDVAVGLMAPLVALALARRTTGAHALAISWNLLGLMDLIVAVGMGTGLLAPILAPHLGPRVPPAAAMGTFPLILVPALAVPLSMLLHFLCLANLLKEVRLTSGPLAKPAS